MTAGAEAGVSNTRLYALRDSGAVLALGGGTFRWADAPPADVGLVEISERVPIATLCLETALARHGLIDSIPAAIDIAVPRGSLRTGAQGAGPPAPVRPDHIRSRQGPARRGRPQAYRHLLR